MLEKYQKSYVKCYNISVVMKNKKLFINGKMVYSGEYLIGAEHGFFSSSLEFELESGIGDCLMRGLDRIDKFIK